MAAGSISRPTPAEAISADIVAKLTDALENEESMSPDDLMVVLSEALQVIQELVALTGGQGDLADA